MPPITSLDEAFLFQLLEKKENSAHPVLNTLADAKSLSTVLTKLTFTFNAYEKELCQQVQDNFDEFSSSYNISQSLHTRVFDLLSQVTETEKGVIDTEQNVDNTIKEYQHALDSSQKNQQKIDALEKLEYILQVMDTIHQELDSCYYLKAVDHLLELTRIIKAWQVESQVTTLVHEKIDQLKNTLISYLQDDIRTSIQYNMGSIRILETFTPHRNINTTVHLKQVFDCLDKLGLLAEEMMGIQRLVFKNIFNPYFEKSASHLQVDPVQVEHVGSGGVLQVIDTTQEETKLDPILMLQHIDTMLAFFFKYMFNNSKETELNHLFGNLFLPELENIMIEKGIAPSIPSSKETLSDFNLITKAVHDFESTCMTQYGFQVDTNSTLRVYVNNIDKHFAKKRREKMLIQGRKVMIRKVYDADLAEINQAGHVYRFKITQTPQILSVLVFDTIEEASELQSSHPISASTLMEGIQDLLDMYRAIMPSYHRSQYLSGPSCSLLFRNDCLWLANQLKSSKTTVAGLATTLEMASERLAELGKAWYELTMMHRVQMIKSSLDTMDGFSGMAENNVTKFQHDCDQAVAQVIQLVHSFAKEIQPVVDETLFLDMLGRIVDSVLSRLIHDIEELVDIGAEESHVIAVTLNSLAQLVGAFDLPEKDATEGFVLELVPSWEKFWLLKDILEMNMRDIMESYRKGNLHMFEKNELEGLLRSLFAETELRAANIEEIKTGRMQHVHSPITVASPSLQRDIPSSASPSILNSALEYTPDDDTEVAAGWGDDDDLFADEAPRIPSSTKIQSKPSLSLDPDMDLDMEDHAGGWGDADEDIFDQLPETEQPTLDDPIQSESTPLTSAIKTPSATSAPSLNIQGIDEEIDSELKEGEGWGWDDDDDLFKGDEEDLK